MVEVQLKFQCQAVVIVAGYSMNCSGISALKHYC